jgi:hypothetical protein
LKAKDKQEVQMLRKKVKNLEAHLKPFSAEEGINVSLLTTDAHRVQITALGFSWPLKPGEHLLPGAQYGIASRRNAEGYEIIHKDQPKETRYRQKPWTWFEFHGRDKVEQSKIVDVPYTCYPRTTVRPYGVELQVRPAKNGQNVLAAGPIYLNPDEASTLLNTVHMFIELFGEAVLVSKELDVAEEPPRRQLNWVILPLGKRPWEEVDTAIGRAISQTSPADQIVIKSRFDVIKAYDPDFCATGQHGFNRYVVYGWETQQVYLLESTEVDNATYVLKDNWQTVSAMTKAEVLHSAAHHARLIHRKTWTSELTKLMRHQNIPLKRTPGNGGLA